MTIQIVNQSYKGISTLSITRLNDNVVYNFPSPETFNVSSNIAEKIQNTRNELGERVRASTYKMEEMPELNISYGFITNEMVSFRLGRQLAQGTFDTSIPRQLQITANDVPADATGGVYASIADDAEAVASITVSGISTPLVRQPFATFDPVTPLSFAVGASGALKFSDDLVTQKEIVTIVTPVVGVEGARISDALVGPIAVRAKLVTSRNTVDFFEAPNCSVNLGGASFDFGGDGGSEIGLFLNNIVGKCTAWNIISTQLTVSC